MIDANPAPDAERLTALLSQQRDLYRALRELSTRQRGLIAGDRPELLLNILRDRQTLVASLARLNEELAPFRRNWDERYAALPAGPRGTISGLLDEINQLLRGILKSDEEDSQLLSTRKHATAREIQSLSGSRSANSAYARSAAVAAGSATADLTG